MQREKWQTLTVLANEAKQTTRKKMKQGQLWQEFLTSNAKMDDMVNKIC